MYWNKTTPDEERLAQRLREEALRDRPEFSESLHRRICGAVEQTRTTPLPAEDHLLPQPRRRSGWLAMGLAASLILAALVAWQTSRNAPVARFPVVPRVDLPTTGEATSTIAPSADPSHAQRSVAPQMAAETAQIAPAVAVDEAPQILARIDRTLASSQWAFLDHDARLTWQLVTQTLPLSAAARSGEDW
ncbi:MAG: hypothetical protein EA424_00275 [Planctomycetaceae bacterium]|nr:MAG: hypothetical protein EA424_00275 [Planctomycetaceae bacterium]